MMFQTFLKKFNYSCVCRVCGGRFSKKLDVTNLSVSGKGNVSEYSTDHNSTQENTELKSRDGHDHSSVRDQSEKASAYDIVIAGGGMVGGAMAAALGCEPLLKNKKIALLEAAPRWSYSGPGPVYSSRTCALSPATKNLFQGFDAWKHIENARYQPVKKMHVADSCSDSFIAFEGDQPDEDLAYIVENDIIQDAIMKQITELCGHIDVKYEARVESYDIPLPNHSGDFTESMSQVDIQLQSGEQLQTKLLIGADGFNSLVRKTADIDTIVWDYDQIGVVSTLRLSESSSNHTAWQRFLPTGPIALLPLSSEFSCLIWSTTREQAKHLLGLNEESFIDAVNHALWHNDDKDPTTESALTAWDNVLNTVGLNNTGIKQYPPTFQSLEPNTRAAFPLVLRHASQYVKTGVALIGDAAHRLHPLAGQGVNLGFGDVTCLTDTLAQAVYNGKDLGEISHLLHYETERQKQVVPTMMAVDGLYRLYSTSWTPAVVLRSLGLHATNVIGPIKDQIKKFAGN